MKLNTKYFDLWLFHRCEGKCQYLLLKASQEKATKWFNGAQFWQIPTDEVTDCENIDDSAKRLACALGLSLTSLWSADYD